MLHEKGWWEKGMWTMNRRRGATPTAGRRVPSPGDRMVQALIAARTRLPQGFPPIIKKAPGGAFFA